ncbi:MAG: M28 family peptidase [Planctomycetes bacterium]|nr:M28 family peptidase [Planctomycetota bacterium]
MSGPEQPSQGTPRALLALALFLGGWWLVALRMEPAPARASNAPANEFSSQRALERWRALPGTALPHPVGSPAHEELRVGIVEALRALGCEPQVQETVVSQPGKLGLVRNVLARIPGKVHEGAVLLAAHYDSVPAGPGAGDDGAGAASVLEIARALKSGPPLERDVILLIDDAEELGLLGAHAFCEQHEWARDVALCVNLEARGSSGPCFLFETSQENAALLTLAARVLAQPSAWSASYEVYKRMPNDTDLTVFKQQGWQGYNLAFLRDLRHYHTPCDDAAHLSPESVQQMGTNALALVRGMANDLLDPQAHGRAVYADFLGLVLLHWNQRSNLPIALGLALAIAFALWTRRRDRGWRLLPVLTCAGTALGGLLLAAGVAAGLQALALAGGSSDWPHAAEPVWMRVALLAGAVAAWFALASAPWNLRATLEERWAGTAVFLALFAIGLALGLPAASYLAILPLVLTLMGFSMHEIARERKPRGKPWMLAAPAFVMSAGVSGPLLVALEWVFEFRVSAALGLLAGLVFLPLWIMAAEAPRSARAIALAALVLAIACVFGARRSPAWTEDHPAPLTLQHYQESSGGEARWILESFESELPRALAADFTRTELGPLGPARAERSLFTRPAPRLEVAHPQFESQAGSAAGTAQIALASPADARRMILILPEGWTPRALECEGRSTTVLPGRNALELTGFGRRSLRLLCERPARPDREENLQLFEFVECDKSAAREWIDKRPREFVPISLGDLSIVRSTRNP